MMGVPRLKTKSRAVAKKGEQENLTKKRSSSKVSLSDSEDISDDGEDLMVKAQSYVEEVSEEELDSDVGSTDEGSCSDLDSDGSTKSGSDKKKVYKKRKVAQSILPSAEEVGELLEQGDQFGTRLFKLQVEELVTATSVPFHGLPQLDASLKELKTCLDCIPEFHKVSLAEAKSQVPGVEIPFPEPGPEQDGAIKFSCMAPSQVQLVGSYPLGMLLRTSANNDSFQQPLTVDVAVEMPSCMFADKDYLNNRYFHKRALYLAIIASTLTKTKLGQLTVVSKEFTLVDNDQRRPGLLVKLKDGATKPFQIRILPSIAPSTFPLSRFAPRQSNLRSKDGVLYPTPHYNTALARDTVYSAHLTYLYHHTQQCPGFSSAVILIKAWLGRRGFGENGHTCKSFGGAVSGMLLAHLLRPSSEGGGLSTSLASYQLFKAFLEFVASHDFQNEPIMIGSSPDVNHFSADAFSDHFSSPIVVDPTGVLHLTPGLTLNDWGLIQLEAQRGVALISNPLAQNNLFQALFLDNARTMEVKFDHVASFVAPSALPESWQTDSNKLDTPDQYLQLVQALPQFIASSLTDRVKLVCCYYDDYPSWSVATQFPPGLKRIHLGVWIDPDQSRRLVDRGPSPHAEPEKAQRFREVWGERAELRKFQDGSILESVVWPCSHIEERRQIVQRMFEYLLRRHLGIRQLRFWGAQLNSHLVLSNTTARGSSYLESTQKGFQPAIEAFDKLVRAVKDVELPLFVSAVAATAQGLRYTSVFIPQPISLHQLSSLPASERYMEAMDAVIELESSSQWPEHLESIQRLKAALLLELQRKLTEVHHFNATLVQWASDSTTPDFAADVHLDVWVQPGFLFRLRIRCGVEEEVYEDELAKAVKDQKSGHVISRLETGLSLYRRRFGYKLWLSPRLHGLTQANPILSPTVRLFQRWVSSHLLASHFTSEALELICAAIFFSPTDPCVMPSSALAGFSRVLHRVANHPFDQEPLPIQFPGIETNPNLPAILAGEEITRSLNPHKLKLSNKVVLVAAPEEGPHPLSHEDLTVSPVIIRRLQQLAAATLSAMGSVLRGPLLTPAAESKAALSWFVPPTNHFDAVIKLVPSLLPRRHQALLLSTSSEVDSIHSNTDSLAGLRPDFDPAHAFLSELKERYSPLLQFFYDSFGGSFIGVAIDRSNSVLKSAPFRTSIPYPVKPTDFFGHDNSVQLNLDAIFSEIQRLGKGLISDITFQAP